MVRTPTPARWQPLQEFADTATDADLAPFCESLEGEVDEHSKLLIEAPAIARIADQFRLSEDDAEAVFAIWRERC